MVRRWNREGVEASIEISSRGMRAVAVHGTSIEMKEPTRRGSRRLQLKRLRGDEGTHSKSEPTLSLEIGVFNLGLIRSGRSLQIDEMQRKHLKWNRRKRCKRGEDRGCFNYKMDSQDHFDLILLVLQDNGRNLQRRYPSFSISRSHQVLAAARLAAAAQQQPFLLDRRPAPSATGDRCSDFACSAPPSSEIRMCALSSLIPAPKPLFRRSVPYKHRLNDCVKSEVENFEYTHEASKMEEDHKSNTILGNMESNAFLGKSADVKKQTVFFLQTADVWSTSSAAEVCRCGPQTADVLTSKKQTAPYFCRTRNSVRCGKRWIERKYKRLNDKQGAHQNTNHLCKSRKTSFMILELSNKNQSAESNDSIISLSKNSQEHSRTLKNICRIYEDHSRIYEEHSRTLKNMKNTLAFRENL
ncbi:hypothetical protein LXL04_022881 [Taraxacum kok-saghyz]